MSEQCKGITLNGTRCKIKSNLVEGYCRIHRTQAEQNLQEQSEVQEKVSQERSKNTDEAGLVANVHTPGEIHDENPEKGKIMVEARSEERDEPAGENLDPADDQISVTAGREYTEYRSLEYAVPKKISYLGKILTGLIAVLVGFLLFSVNRKR